MIPRFHTWPAPSQVGLGHKPKARVATMAFVRPVPPKEKEIYELNSDEDFSSIITTKTSKVVVYFHFLILAM
jgi:hypothetical protein